MPYNIKELLELPDEEKLILANELWSTVGKTDNDELNSEEIEFIEQRLKEHETTPANVMSWNEMKEKINKKYGF